MDGAHYAAEPIESLTDFLRDALDNTPSSSTYLDHLVSLPLEDLHGEPSLISSETATVEAELTNLCYREYSTFTAVHKCSAAIDSAFDDFGASLVSLLQSAPALEDACQQFSQSTSAVQATRQRATLIQEHQNKLVELLELPQLMDTCVRNGFYQEAMELAAHAEHLTRHANPLVLDVAAEVEQILQIMATQLLALLREPVKLPTLVKAVNFLRRLGTLEDLGLAFLASRLYNYRSQLDQLDRDRGDPVRYVRRYIDHFREHVYDIISQFSTIFDPSPHLVSFAFQCVEDLVQVVTTHIPRISDSGSLSSILVQLGYCSLSFARVGLDFAPLITDPFLGVIERSYAQAISLATSNLVQQLKAPIETADASISSFPPLTAFFNSHITALNTLRLLAPIQLKTRMINLQQSALMTASAALLQHCQQAVAPIPNEPSSPRSALLRRNTETQFTPEIRAARRRATRRSCIAMARVWTQDVVPVLAKGLFSIYETDGTMECSDISLWIEEHEENGTRTPDAY